MSIFQLGVAAIAVQAADKAKLRVNRNIVMALAVAATVSIGAMPRDAQAADIGFTKSEVLGSILGAYAGNRMAKDSNNSGRAAMTVIGGVAGARLVGGASNGLYGAQARPMSQSEFQNGGYSSQSRQADENYTAGDVLATVAGAAIGNAATKGSSSTTRVVGTMAGAYTGYAIKNYVMGKSSSTTDTYDPTAPKTTFSAARASTRELAARPAQELSEVAPKVADAIERTSTRNLVSYNNHLESLATYERLKANADWGFGNGAKAAQQTDRQLADASRRIELTAQANREAQLEWAKLGNKIEREAPRYNATFEAYDKWVQESMAASRREAHGQAGDIEVQQDAVGMNDLATHGAS